MPDISDLRAELTKACRILYATGAVGDGLSGHLSARLDEERILIKPRPISWRGLQPDDLIVIGLDGVRVGVRQMMYANGRFTRESMRPGRRYIACCTHIPWHPR